MQHSTKQPKLSEVQRFRAMQECGCVACILDGNVRVPGEVNHIVKGRKRLGHEYTYLLCAYHHRNVPPRNGLKHGEAERNWGPTLAASPKAFRERYGTDEVLLEIQNALIEPFLREWREGFS